LTKVADGDALPGYYGWTVARAAFGILGVTYGLQYTFGVLIPEIELSTGWSRTRLSGLYSMYLFVYSVLGAFTGRLSDRIGPRRVIAAGGLLFGLGWISLATFRGFWPVAIGFCGVAAIGMSASFVPCSATVIKWFSARRGAALSLAISGAGLGGLVFPPVVNALIGVIGWRVTVVVLATLVGGWVIYSSHWMAASPEAMGSNIGDELRRRARSGSHQSTPEREPYLVTEVSSKLSEALRTPDFWIIGAMFMSSWFVVFVPIVHLAPFVTSLGGSPALAAIALSAIGLGGLIGRVFSGPAADRLGEIPIVIAMMLLQVAVYLIFATSGSFLLIIIAAIVFGAGYGGTVTLFSAIVGSRFGRLNAGSILGALFIGAAAASAAGPLMAGALYDRTGGYQGTFIIGAIANTAAAILGTALYVIVRQSRELRCSEAPAS
jgi:MFS family permease